MFKKLLLVLIAGLFVLGITGVSFAQTESQKEPAAAEISTVEQSLKAINAGNKICPVSGEKINEETKAAYEYQGKIYNFCCPACIEDFKKDPKKYIKKVEEELQAESKEAGGHEEHRTGTMQESETMHQGMHEGQHH